MLVQINTDHNIEGREQLSRHVEEKIQAALNARFGERLTRVEVHLGDENSSKKGGGADKRCLLEARPAGLQPIAVSHQAESLNLAVDGALAKFKRALGHAFGKQKNH
ncbi:MAG: HPF/RaiA family ribosome-associated protein [Woeseia sp.]